MVTIYSFIELVFDKNLLLEYIQIQAKIFVFNSITTDLTSKTYHVSTGKNTINTHTTVTFVAKILHINFL
jgi:hypothetical protein